MKEIVETIVAVIGLSFLLLIVGFMLFAWLIYLPFRKLINLLKGE